MRPLKKGVISSGEGVVDANCYCKGWGGGMLDTGKADKI